MPKSKAQERHSQPHRSRQTRSVWKARADARASTPATQRTAEVVKHEGFDDWLVANWTARWTSVALAVSLCLIAAFAVILLAVNRNQQAYTDAPVCSSTTGANVSCKTELAATVEGKGQSGTKVKDYYVVLAGPQPANGRFVLPEQNALWNSATAGDAVTAVVWKNAVVRIVDGDVGSDTTDAPAFASTTFIALLASAVVCALVLAMLTIRLLVEDRGRLAGWTRISSSPNAFASIFAVLFPVGALISIQWESTAGVLIGGAALPAAAIVFYLVYRFVWWR